MIYGVEIISRKLLGIVLVVQWFGILGRFGVKEWDSKCSSLVKGLSQV